MRIRYIIYILYLLINSINVLNCYKLPLISSYCIDNKINLKISKRLNINKIIEKKYNYEEYFYNNEDNMKILKKYYDYYDKYKTAENIDINIYETFEDEDYINDSIELKYDIDFNKEFLNMLYNSKYVKDIYLSKYDNTALITFHNASKHEYIYKKDLF